MQLHWLAPAGLLLIGLALLPLLAHLIRQKPKDVRLFGAMMLIKRLRQTNKKRNRIQDLFLLLLRILMLLLVGLAILQPELRWPDPNRQLERASSIAIIVDTSLSMNQRVEEEGKTALELAKERAISFVKELPEEVAVSVLTVGGTSEVLTDGFTRDKAVVLALLSTISQTEESTNLKEALQSARRMFDGQGGEIFLYTDESGPGLFDSISEEIKLLLTQKVSLLPEIVRSEHPQNLVVTSAQYGEGIEGGSVQFTLMNFGDTKREAHCTVELPDGTEITTFVEAQPEQETKSFVTVPRIMEGGIGKIHVDDQGLSRDNDHYFHLPRIGASRILVIDGDPGVTTVTSEVYFLERALSPFGKGSRNSGLQPDIVGEFGISSLNPEEHRVVFLANVSDPSSMSGRLIDFVRNGGGLVVSMGANVSPDRYNAALSELLPAPLRKIEQIAGAGGEGVPTRMPDASIELFSPFVRGGLREFSSVTWQRILRLEPYEESTAVQTLLRLENGFPLLIKKSVGKGTVLLLASTIDHQWGNFPLRSVYMPLIQRMVGVLGGASTSGTRLSGEVGEDLSMALSGNSDELVWDGAAGKTSAIIKDGKAWLYGNKSGPYQLSVEGGPPMAWVALNTPILESDIRVDKALLASAAEIAPEHFMERFTIAPWLLLGALMLMLLQAIFTVQPNKTQEVTV